MKSRNGSLKDEELSRWTPRVVLKRLTKQEIARASDDWSFLNHIYIISDVTLHCEVVAQHKSFDGTTSRTLLRYTHPRGVCRYEWTENNVSINGTNIVDVQNLRWYEKLLLRPFVKH